MAATYYIDGYNVIHHSSILRPIAAQNFESAREALIEKVALFCVATGYPAKIIFDGRGRRAEPAPVTIPAPGLEVVYAAGHKSADAYIERLVYTAHDRRSVIVVSADAGIRNFCRGLQAMVMAPDNFLATVRETAGETRSRIENLQRSDTLQRVEERLDPGMLDRLRKIKEDLGG